MRASETDLLQIATDAGLRPHVFAAEAGDVLVTEHGARILGIFLQHQPENLLWVHPQVLAGSDSARQYVRSGAWNLGGDRCWFAPELDLHFKNPAQPSHEDYVVPAGVDPGDFIAGQLSANAIALRNVGTATNLRSKQTFRFELTREVRLTYPPLDIAGLDFAGYELSSLLTIPEVDRPEAQYGLWHLMQVPPGGNVSIPLRNPQPDTVDYFDTNIAGHITAHPTHIEFPVTGTAQHKLGLPAQDVTGAMAYLRPAAEGQATLIVRQATVFPGARYADYPGAQPDRRDIALQFYNDSGSIGGFGELEYHAPAASANNFFRVRDTCRTWCFGGPTDRVLDIARQLLGVPISA
jgi:hypothetical protein